MVSNSIANHPVSLLRKPASGFLGNFIDNYTIRKISVQQGTDIIKFMPCRHFNSIDFFTGDDYITNDLKTGSVIPFVRCTIRGPRTYKKYQIRINGNFCCYSVKFKPTGLNRLLGISMDFFRDAAIDATLLYPGIFGELTERLMECKDIRNYIEITEKYLVSFVRSHSYQASTATRLAELILRSNSTFHLTELYTQLPLTSRQLERNFIKEVGVSPKEFSSIVRFERLVHNHMNQPDRRWTELAHEYNYFDQMHMIRDFKKFLDIIPSDFCFGDFAF